jgi:Flp pilus assembly protein TadD
MPTTAELFALAWQNHQAGNFHAAEQLHKQILQRESSSSITSDFAGVYCNLGSALERQGRLDEAVAAYREAIKLRPQLAEVHYNLGKV